MIVAAAVGTGDPQTSRQGEAHPWHWSKGWKILQSFFHASISWWTLGLEFSPCLSMEHPGLRFCQHQPNHTKTNPGPEDLQFYPADKQQDTEFSSQRTCWRHTNRSQPDFQCPQKHSCLFFSCFILQTNFSSMLKQKKKAQQIVQFMTGWLATEILFPNWPLLSCMAFINSTGSHF